MVANGSAFLVNLGITFILPRAIGVREYSYYQLFYFYLSYIGYLHFGWADGVYLRLGGMYYEKLDKEKLKTEAIFYFLFTLAIASVIFIYSICCGLQEERRFIGLAMAFSVINILPISLFLNIFQATNRIKEYSMVIILRSVLFLVIIVVLLLCGISEFRWFCTGYVLAQFFSLCYAFYSCRDIFESKGTPWRTVIPEIKKDFSVGIKLTVSALTSVLIVGVVRFGIERNWDIETFGKVSLTISASNLLMLFVRAVSLVMFPVLRRTDRDKLEEIYGRLRTVLVVLLLGLLILYYPMKQILSLWLPQYAESLQYMAILFPMCIFESKMSFLVETYMKTLRKEKELLFVNVVSVMLSIVITIITVQIAQNLFSAVLSIVFLLAFRSTLAELMLTRNIHVAVWRNIVKELIVTAVFIFSSWSIGGLAGVAVYSVAYFLYLYSERKKLHEIVDQVR